MSSKIYLIKSQETAKNKSKMKAELKCTCWGIRANRESQWKVRLWRHSARTNSQWKVGHFPSQSGGEAGEVQSTTGANRKSGDDVMERVQRPMRIRVPPPGGGNERSKRRLCKSQWKVRWWRHGAPTTANECKFPHSVGGTGDVRDDYVTVFLRFCIWII